MSVHESVYERLSSPLAYTVSERLRSSQAAGARSSPASAAAARVRARYEAAEQQLQTLSSPTQRVGVMGGGSALVLPRGSSASDEGDEALDTSLHLQLLFQYYARFGRGSATAVESAPPPSDEASDMLTNVAFAKFCRVRIGPN